MQYDFLKELAFEQLMQTPTAENIQKVVDILEQAQTYLDKLRNTEDDSEIMERRIGTVLILAIFEKMSSGKMPQNFNQDDWTEIAKAVSKYGVLIDGQHYSVFVFNMYARYIDYTVSDLEGYTSQETTEIIQAQADELRSLADSLLRGDITEPAYVEKCLWITLEAIIRILAGYAEVYTGPEVGKLIQATVIYAFEYGRYQLYAREQAQLGEYLDHQHQLDKELHAKYDQFIAELQVESAHKNELIENAFDHTYGYSVQASVELARAAGVDEKKILDSREKIAAFFM